MTADDTKERPILFSSPMVRALLDGRKTQTRRVVDLRRAPKCAKDCGGQTGVAWADEGLGAGGYLHVQCVDGASQRYRCPYGSLGDRLWVRETCCAEERADGADGVLYFADDVWMLIADTQNAAEKWFELHHYGAGLRQPESTDDTGAVRGKSVPSIHMPRWASRITLTLTDVRVERVQDISEDDAHAEGIPPPVYASGVFGGSNKFAAPGVTHTNVFGDHDMEAPAYDSAAAAYACLWDSINAARGFGWDANPWVWAMTFSVAIRSPESTK